MRSQKRERSLANVRVDIAKNFYGDIGGDPEPTKNNGQVNWPTQTVRAMAKKKKANATKKAVTTKKSSAPKKAAGKSAGKATKKAAKTTTKTNSVKAAAAKSPATPSAKTVTPKSSQKVAAKAKASSTPAKSSAKKAVGSQAAPSAGAAKAKAGSKPAGAVAQVASALKSVANKVTSALSTVTGDSKKKVKNSSSKSAVDFASLFSPLDDRLVVERDGISNRTAGGLYIPDTVSDSEKPNRGVVMAVGPGHRTKKGNLRPLDVQQGDRVLFSKWAGSEINLEGRELVLIRESDVVAIVNE